MSNRRRIRERPVKVSLVSDEGLRRNLTRRETAVILAARADAHTARISLTEALERFSASVDELLAEDA